MKDFTIFIGVPTSHDIVQVECQNQNLKKSNTILYGIIALAILVFVGSYILTHEDEKDR